MADYEKHSGGRLTRTGLSAAEADNIFGKVSLLEPSAEPIRFEKSFPAAARKILLVK